MEVPLVMRALNARQTEFNELVSRVLTFDYLGALAVSLLFPLVLAPYLGLVRTGFLFGMLNVGVALWTIKAFSTELKNVTGRLAHFYTRWRCGGVVKPLGKSPIHTIQYLDEIFDLIVRTTPTTYSLATRR